MKSIQSPEGVSLLMEDLWLRHKVCMKQRQCNVYMVELPPPATEEELVEVRHKAKKNSRPDDKPEELFGAMDWTYMTDDERYEMMRKRHAFFCDIVRPYSSLDELAHDKDEWFALHGIELTLGEKYISLYIQLDYTEYESYHIIPDGKGCLTVSTVIWWQNQYCANELMDIFTLESADEEDILTSIHDHP